jgi:predicted PurR-regulated permease PerM
MNPQPQHDLTRTTLVVLFIGVLIVGSLWTMLPFLGALIWATTIVVATWPLLLFVQRLVGGNRAVATAIMTGVALAIFIVPFWFALGTLLDGAVQGADLARTYLEHGLGPPPAWLNKVPWVGSRIAAEWRELAAGGPEALIETARPYIRSVAAWLLSITGGFGVVLLHFILTVIIAAILYSKGEVAAHGVLRFFRRFGQERGEQIVHLAGQSIRGVALGVIVTALVQSLMAGLGLWVAGVPRPGLLLAVIFVLGVAQLGPLPVLLPAVIWLYWSGSVGWAVALFVWMIIVGALDNVLRPILIRRGVDLPLLLIIAGVIGGLIAFGVVGLFIGPVILAVTYTLLESWINEGRAGTT